MTILRRTAHILIATLLLLTACFAGARLAAEATTIPLGDRCWDTSANKLGWTTPAGCDTRRPWTECWEAHLAHLTGTFRADQYPARLLNGTVCQKPWWVR